LAPFPCGVLPRVATTVQSITCSPAEVRLMISEKTASTGRILQCPRYDCN
jgi:hypothetical protein